jgi:hypothetical protein
MSINVEKARELITKLGEAFGVEMDPPKEREERSPKDLFDEAVLEVTKAVEAGNAKLALEKLAALKAMAHEQVGGKSLPEQNDQTTAAKEYSDKTSPAKDVVQPTPTAWSSNGLQKALGDLMKVLEELAKGKMSEEDEKKKPKEKADGDAEKACADGKKKKTDTEKSFDDDLSAGMWPSDVATDSFRENVQKNDPDDWGSDPWSPPA